MPQGGGVMGRATKSKTLLPAWAVPGLVLLNSTRTPIEKKYTHRTAAAYQDRAYDTQKRIDEALRNIDNGGTLGLCPPPGLLIIDADNDVAVRWLEEVMPADCPRQYRKEDKQHWYVRVDAANFPVYTRALKIEINGELARVDTRSWGYADETMPGGGYAVIPPSISNKDGIAYTWARPLPDTVAEIPMIPDKVVGVLMPHFTRGVRARNPRAAAAEESRHDQVIRYAARAVRYESRSDPKASIARVVSKTRELIEELFAGDPVRANQEFADCDRHVASAWDQWGGDAALDEKGLDVKLASEVLSHYDSPWAFCEDTARWYEWNGWVWQHVGPLGVQSAVMNYADVLLEDALRERDAARRSALYKNALALNKVAKVVSVAKAIQIQVLAKATDFDANPDLITFPGSEGTGRPAVTLNTFTGATHEPKKDDRITLLAGCPYAPEAHDEVVDTWWDTSFPDSETRAAVEEMVGVSISGRIHEEKIYCLFGTQGSGKGTLGFSIVAALGDYGMVGNGGLISGQGSYDGSRKDFSIVGLKGRRVVYFDEFDGSMGEKAKTLSQAGRMTGAIKHVQGDVTFDMTHTIWMSSNRRPKINDPQGFTRRLVEIPMNAGARDIHNLDDSIKFHMMQSEAGRTAMMARVLRGLDRARAKGFKPATSKMIVEGSKEWLQEANKIGEWISRGCVVTRDPKDQILSAFNVYTAWMDDQHMDRKDYPRASKNEFSALMQSMGFESKMTKKGKVFLGLREKGSEDREEAVFATTSKLRAFPRKVD
jgi:phage/plasmid-associated DNA primase